MRTDMLVLALASLAAFTAVGADSIQPQQVQMPGSAAAASTPAASEPASAQDSPVAAAAVQQASAAASATDAAAAEAASTPPAAADPSDSTGAAAAQPITLKMATVPPPADFRIPAGYRAMKRGLDTIYCTDIAPIGSRMTKRYCMSREQVEEIARQAEINRRDIAQKSVGCVGGGCGGN